MARRRQTEKRKRALIRGTKAALGNFTYVLLAVAVVAVVAAIGAIAQHTPATAANGTGPASGTASGGPTQVGVTHPTCGAPGLPACQVLSGWASIASTAPGDLIAAARKSTLFNVDRSGNGDYLKDLSHLETPVYVRALVVPGSVVMPDFYVIPVDAADGSIVGAAELALNASHTAIHVEAIITYTTPHPHGAMARLDVATALSHLSAAQHTSARAGAQPALIYFPVDAAAQEAGEIVWNAGGEYPADPIWLIPGADGQDHVVGANGSVYAVSQLPIMRQ